VNVDTLAEVTPAVSRLLNVQLFDRDNFQMGRLFDCRPQNSQKRQNSIGNFGTFPNFMNHESGSLVRTDSPAFGLILSFFCIFSVNSMREGFRDYF
jgi:hypothetical protein